ncbi:MAG: M48 family metallopeptidase [Taibaiella sp.]|nr:M48 family metallopeptidase [Taibaiella sp.]
MSSKLPAYTVKRSKRKTLSIYIERDGNVSVLAPEQNTDAEIETIVTQKSYQIYKHLAEHEELNATKTQREIANGESFLYLGRNYRLQLVKDQEVPLKLKDGHFYLLKTLKDEAQEVFKTFYREKALPRITSRVEHYKGQMGVIPGTVRVMELHNRWASCSRKGDLNFHWKCLMAPLTVLDYIIVHEMAHLIHDSHNEAFWNVVDKILPDYRERKAWLKFNGAGMDL